MSDETTAVRNDMDPAAQVAADLKARLRAMPGAELVELAAQLMLTYVIESVVPLARASDSTDLAADSGGEESFAQMLKRLKAAKRDPVLEKFQIDGENISVRIDGYGTLPITDYRRPSAPSAPGQAPAAPQPRRESVPGAAGSIYNRALYQPEAAPAAPLGAAAPARGAPRTAPAAPAPAAANPANPAQPGQKKEDGSKNDRFALIELD